MTTSPTPPAVSRGASPAASRDKDLKVSRGSILSYCIIAAVLAVLAVIIYFQFTKVSGLEIDTQSWRIRQFTFRRDPLSNFQLSGVMRSSPSNLPPWKNAGGKHAVIGNEISKHLSKNPRGKSSWDLVRISDSGRPADAATLVDLLSATDPDDRPFWTNWSRDNPDKAAILWPAIQNMAYLQLYSYMPELFKLAVTQLSADELQQKIELEIQLATLERAKLLISQDELEPALSLAQFGLEFGDHPELQAIVLQLSK